MKSCKSVVIIFIMLFGHQLLPAQIIVSVAGTGVLGSTGDGGPATAARLDAPGFGAFDGAGNYYFGEGTSSTPRVRKITPAGIITTVAGSGGGFGGDGGPATLARLQYPYCNVDAAGNIYIADEGNYRVRKVDVATGIIHTIAGNGTNSSTGNGGPATNATLWPIDVCVDGYGNVFVSDNTGSIRKINQTTGIITFVAGVSALGMQFDPFGKLYIGGGAWVAKVDTATGVIDTIAGTGLTSPFNGDLIPATSANFQVYDIALDAIGNIYIADGPNDRIRMVDTSGIIHTIAGTGVAGYNGDGGLADTSEVNNPEGVVFDACGNLYIAATHNNRIRKVIFNTTGVADIIISPSPGDSVCKDDLVTFNSTVSAGTALAYQWYVDGSAVPGATGSTYIYPPVNGDSVRCVLISVSQCSGNTDTVSSNTINMVVINPTIPTISISGITTASLGTVVTLTATVTNTGSSYNIKWFNNGLLFSTTTTPTVTYTKATGPDNITARILPIPTATVPACYDSATSAVHTITDTSTGIIAVTAGQLHIYPNPVSNVLYIDGVVVQAQYSLLSIVGAVMQQGALKAGSNSILMQSLPAGMYMVVVTSGDRQRAVSEVIKE